MWIWLFLFCRKLKLQSLLLCFLCGGGKTAYLCLTPSRKVRKKSLFCFCRVALNWDIRHVLNKFCMQNAITKQAFRAVIYSVESFLNVYLGSPPFGFDSIYGYPGFLALICSNNLKINERTEFLLTRLYIYLQIFICMYVYEFQFKHFKDILMWFLDIFLYYIFRITYEILHITV